MCCAGLCGLVVIRLRSFEVCGMVVPASGWCDAYHIPRCPANTLLYPLLTCRLSSLSLAVP